MPIDILLGAAEAATSTRLVFVLAAAAALTSCMVGPTLYRNPLTGQLVQCGGTRMPMDAMAASVCAVTHSTMGWAMQPFSAASVRPSPQAYATFVPSPSRPGSIARIPLSPAPTEIEAIPAPWRRQQAMLVPPRTRDLGLPAAEEPERVRSVQTHMRLLGYPVPRDDGVLDEETRAAIRAFQKRVGITPDGRMSQRLQDQLQAEFNLCVVVRSMAAEPSSIDQHCARPAPTASASRLLGRGDPYAIVPPLREEERNDRAEAAPAGERGTRTR